MARKRILSAATLAHAVEQAQAMRRACVLVQTEAPIFRDHYNAAAEAAQAMTRFIEAVTGQKEEPARPYEMPGYRQG